MDNSAIGLMIPVAALVALLIGLASNWTEWVQAHKLRLCAAAWGHTILPRRPVAPRRAAGAPAGTATASAALPVGVSAPPSRPIPGVRAGGSLVLPGDATPLPPHVGADTAPLLAPPFRGQGCPRLTTAAQCPDRRAAVVHHLVSES